MSQISNEESTIRYPRSLGLFFFVVYFWVFWGGACFYFFLFLFKKKMLSKSFQLHELCMLRGLKTASCVSPPAVLFLC